MNDQGIYILYFPIDDNKYYIGQSIYLSSRFKRHLSQLKNNTHYNKLLQETYNALNILPEYDIIEYVEKVSLLDDREIYWIKEFDSYNNGYNQTLGGHSAGYGEYGANSLYTKDTYIDIAKELATNKPYRQIAKELNVSDRVVSSIGTGQAHRWLHEEIPDIYEIILSKIGQRSKSESDKDRQIRIFKELVYTNNRLIDIAKTENVHVSVVEKITYGTSCLFLKDMFPEEYNIMLDKNGNRRVLAARKDPYPNIKDPSGNIYKIDNARAFCREHNLSQSSISQLLLGRTKQYKGWTLA